MLVQEIIFEKKKGDRTVRDTTIWKGWRYITLDQAYEQWENMKRIIGEPFTIHPSEYAHTFRINTFEVFVQYIRAYYRIRIL